MEDVQTTDGTVLENIMHIWLALQLAEVQTALSNNSPTESMYLYQMSVA